MTIIAIIAIIYLAALCYMIRSMHRRACDAAELAVSRYYLRRMHEAYFLRKSYADYLEAMRAEELFLCRGAA